MEFGERLWLAVLAALSVVSPQAAPADDHQDRPAPPISISQPAPLPIKRPNAISPIVGAKSALLLDVPSGTTLYAKDPEKSLPIASLTKLMSAYVATRQVAPDEIVTIPPMQIGQEESRIGVQVGQRFRADDLLAASLIASANDATLALAIHAAGSVEEFTKLMNERAKELGMEHTRFTNPTGYDQGENYSSTRDLAALSRNVLTEPRIGNVVGLKEAAIRDADGAEIKLQTTDQLLGGYLPIAGLKTGTTDAAGQCLISLLVSGDRQILAIVLASPDRFQENKSMLDWALTSYRW